MKSIIITGATGMIGANIVSQSLLAGYRVMCVVRPGSPKEMNLPCHENLKVVYSDISAYGDVETGADYDALFHLAWEKPFGDARDDADAQLRNIQYTLDAVRLAKRAGCSVFVGAGSQAEYGPVTHRLTASTPVNPLSGYGIAKYAAGKLSGLLCAQLGMRHNWVRVLSVYGSLDNPYTLISYVRKRLNDGLPPELTDCTQVWDYLHESDAASAFLSIADKGRAGRTYVLGSGIGRPLRDYIDEMVSLINPSVFPRYGVKPFYPNQPMYMVADIDELRSDTGWEPKVMFSEGIASMSRNKGSHDDSARQ